VVDGSILSDRENRRSHRDGFSVPAGSIQDDSAATQKVTLEPRLNHDRAVRARGRRRDGAKMAFQSRDFFLVEFLYIGASRHNVVDS